MSQSLFDFFQVNPLEILLSDAIFTCFDFETTGLYPDQDKITEIGAVKFNFHGEIGRFHSLVNPGRPIPDKAAQISGISDDMVKDAPGLAEILPDFYNFLSESVLVAHNIGFDSGFLRAGLSTQRLAWKDSWIEFDTCEWARLAFPHCPNYKLQTLITHLSIPSGMSHRALDDALACMALFRKCLEKDRVSPEFTIKDLQKRAGRKK